MNLSGTRTLLYFAAITICLAGFSEKSVAQMPGPSISSISPGHLGTGQTVEITITGTGFQPGAQVMVLNSSISVANVFVISSTEITATLILGEYSWGGSYLQIVDPNGVGTSSTLYVYQAPTLATASLPGAAVAISYSQTLMATGGTAPYTWAITSGNLPAGMALDKNTGILSGAPSAAGTYNFSVTITDHYATSSAPIPLTLVVISASFGVTPSALAFNWAAGDASSPAPGSLIVFSVPSGMPVTVTTSTANGENWLSATASTAVAPANIAIPVTPGALAPGNYTGQITVTPNAGAPVNIPVTFTILQPASPQLQISPSSGHFTLTSTSAAAGGQLSITNSGSGSLQFTAASDQPWLTVTSTNGTATRLAPSFLAYSVNPEGLEPGAYVGHINLTAQNATAAATISLVVTTEANTMQLSRRGLEFTGTQYGLAQPAQTFMVLNNGSGTLNWTAQTLGGSWLTASASGTATSSSPGAVTVTVNQGNLSEGQYYGLVTVTGNSPDAPQSISVVLNVEHATASGVLVSPASLALAPASSGNPASGAVTLFNLSHVNSNYAAFVTTSDGGKWLNTAASGTVAPGASTIAVTASAGGLSFGTYTGSILFAFDDGNSATVPVTMTYSAATSPGCSASALVLTFVQPVSSSFMAPLVAVPQTIQLQVSDNCGNPVSGGALQVAFSNNDPAVDLHKIGSGMWEATWVPANSSSGPVQLTASAALPANAKAISGSATMSVPSVQPAFSNGAANPAAILDAALGAQAIPFAVTPGSYIAIYGNFLADSGSAGASAIPLPQTLASTQVFLGGQPMPVLYASPSQMNVVVPQNLTPGATLSLEVEHNSTYSAPVPVTVSALSPGIYTLNDSGAGPGVVQIAGTTLLAQPTGPGARPAQSGSEFLTIYANGLGPVIGANGEPAPADGRGAQPPAIYHTAATVSATFGGVNAPVTFAGLTPGLVQLYQVNVQVPAGVPTGNAVPLVLTVTSADGSTVATSNTVTVAVQ